MNNKIIVGNDSFGEELAAKIGIPFVKFEKRIFPDGEVCPRLLDDVKAERAVIVNHMKLPIDPNGYFLETLLLAKNLQGLGIRDVDIVMPYFVYGRQDKVFRVGEPSSTKFILDLMDKVSIRRFYTVTSHAQRHKEMLDLAEIPAYNVNGLIPIAQYLKNKKFINPIFIGPDQGSEFFAKSVAKELGYDYDLFYKTRDRDTGKITMSSDIDLTGKEVIFVDDIVSSGRTMVNAINIAKKNGAKEVYVYVVHLVSEKGIENIASNVKEFLSCNTVSSEISKISVIDILAEKLR